ncbi:MAG: hypothetical protein JWN03_4761 [Nocardia sp.]|nr:hypothetical protein [Nocardia sp.]
MFRSRMIRRRCGERSSHGQDIDGGASRGKRDRDRRLVSQRQGSRGPRAGAGRKFLCVCSEYGGCDPGDHRDGVEQVAFRSGHGVEHLEDGEGQQGTPAGRRCPPASSRPWWQRGLTIPPDRHPNPPRTGHLLGPRQRALRLHQPRRRVVIQRDHRTPRRRRETATIRFTPLAVDWSTYATRNLDETALLRGSPLNRARPGVRVVLPQLHQGPNFTGKTELAVTHTHLLALGTLFFLIVIGLEKQFTLSSGGLYIWFFWTYNAGVLWAVTTMTIIGMRTVQGVPRANRWQIWQVRATS